MEVRRRQPLQVAGHSATFHSVVTLKPTLVAPARSPKKSIFSPRVFNYLHPIAPVALTPGCYREVEQRYSLWPELRCPQVNARPVWRFGAGPDSALRTCGARPSGLVLQQRGARQSSGIDSVSVEVLVARNAERFGPPRCVGWSSDRRRTFPGPSPRTAAKRIPTGFAPPPGKDLSRSSPVVQRDQSFEPAPAAMAKCVYDQ